MKKAKTTLPHPANSAHQLSAQQVANLKSQIVTSNAGTPPATPLPADWRMGVLSELCTLVRDQCDPTKTDRDTYVGLEHIDSGAFTLSRSGHPREVVSAKTCFRKGDILYGKLRPYLDKAAIADKDGICSTDILVFRPTKTTCAQYLLALLHTPGFVDYAVQTTHGVNHPRTSWSSLSNFRHPLPPLAEQERIAAILWKIQEAIETEAAIIRNARDLKKSLLRHLFTHGLRNEPLKETEIGKIPESWEIAPLAKVREFLQYGTSERCEIGATGLPVLRIPNVVGGQINTAELKCADLSEREVDRFRLAEGDLLFVRTNGQRDYVGRCAVYKQQPPNALFASYLIRARLNKDLLNPDFLQAYTMTDTGKSYLSGRSHGAADGKFNINTKTIDNVPIPIPSREEQIEIASILQAADAHIEAHEAKQRTLQDLFKTMLNKLMTGQIPVAGLDIAAREAAV